MGSVRKRVAIQIGVVEGRGRDCLKRRREERCESRCPSDFHLASPSSQALSTELSPLGPKLISNCSQPQLEKVRPGTHGRVRPREAFGTRTPLALCHQARQTRT